jgi:hypothetical protein
MPDKPNELTDWDVITEGDLALLGNLKQFLDEQKAKEKARLRALRAIWDEALDKTNNPELFGYNVPIE